MVKKGRAHERTPSNYDEAYDKAIYLEEQGERYQSGPKAQRFYEQAIETYRLAHNFDTKESDPLYNEQVHLSLYPMDQGQGLKPHRARILQTLSTDFWPAQNAIHGLQLAIEKYKQASALDPSSFDISFNLALALTSLGDMAKELRQSSWDVAQELFSALLQAQLSAMDTGDEALEHADSNDDINDDANEEVTVRETRTVVPSSVIDTLLSLADLLLLRIDKATSSSEHQALQQQLEATFAQAIQLDSIHKYDTDRIQIAQAESQLRLLETINVSGSNPSFEQLAESLSGPLSILETRASKDLEQLAVYADAMSSATWMLANATRNTTDQGPTHVTYVNQIADSALDTYHRLITALSSPLTRKSTPAHDVPLIVAKAHGECAGILLLLGQFHKALEQARQGMNVIQPKSANGTVEATRVDWAFREALVGTALIYIRTNLVVAFQESDAKVVQVCQRASTILKNTANMTSTEVQEWVSEEFEHDAVWHDRESRAWKTIIGGGLL